MIFQKFELVVNSSPILVKSIRFFCLQIIIMIGSFFRLIISSLLSDYFSTFIIKHPFLSNPFDSIIVLVSLLLLRDCLTIFMLSRTVLKVTFTLHFTISTHRGRAYKSLTNIGSLFP